MIFQFDDYREIFNFYMDQQQTLGRKITLTELAIAANVQRPYISKVFHHAAEFNLDQAFSVCNYLGFGEKETDYVLKLVEFSRATTLNFKEKLKREIRHLRSENIKVKKHIEAQPGENLVNTSQAYYLDPLIQIVHLHLSINKYKNCPQEIQKALKISPGRLNMILQWLEKEGFIEIDKKKQLNVKKEVLHLSEESPLCLPQQILIRAKSLDRIQSADIESKFCFSVTFSADETAKDKIRNKFNDFIRDVQKIVQKAPPENVYQINFDLFPWS